VVAGAMSDAVFVSGLALHAYHGVMQHEAKVGQTFKLDLMLDIDLGSRHAALRSWGLAHTRADQIVLVDDRALHVRMRHRLACAAQVFVFRGIGMEDRRTRRERFIGREDGGQVLVVHPHDCRAVRRRPLTFGDDDRHRLGVGKVDPPAEAVLGVLGRRGLHPIPGVASGQL